MRASDSGSITRVVAARQSSNLAPTTRATDPGHGVCMRILVRRSAATAFTTVVTAALAAGLTGCGSGGVGAAATAGASATTDIGAIAREYSQCVREHGIPNYPDMVVVGGGRVAVPDGPGAEEAARALKQNKAAQDACKPILDRLPASGRLQQSAPTDAEMRKLVQFAECMRGHGVPEWPDPGPDGQFPIKDTPLQQQAKSPRIVAASEACKQLEAGK